MTPDYEMNSSGNDREQVDNAANSMTRVNTGRRPSFFDTHKMGVQNENPQMIDAADSENTIYWRTVVTFWGGFWGLLLGAAFLWAPIFSPFLLEGLGVVWIMIAIWRTTESVSRFAKVKSIKLRRLRGR